MKDTAKTITDIATRRKVYSVMHMQSIHFTALSIGLLSLNYTITRIKCSILHIILPTFNGGY